MRNISFSLTTAQLRAREKTVTRRLGWWGLKQGELLQAVERSRGLKRGEKVKRICVIRVVSARVEPLNRVALDREYGEKEMALEGFPGMNPADFLRLFADARDYAVPVNRIEFEYV
jgi:hypothetical protein